MFVEIRNQITVYITTIGINGEERVTQLVLEDNLPMDEYTNLWRILGNNTK